MLHHVCNLNQYIANSCSRQRSAAADSCSCLILDLLWIKHWRVNSKVIGGKEKCLIKISASGLRLRNFLLEMTSRYRTQQRPAQQCNAEYQSPTINGATHPHRLAHLRRSRGGRCRCRQTLRCTHTEHVEECHSCVCPSGSGLPHAPQLQVKCVREEMKIWTFLHKV